MSKEYVSTSIGEAALYEQLAEECSELSHAALKLARIIRAENPTPVSYDEALRKVSDEFNDVILCKRILGFKPDESFIKKKLDRWVDRIVRKSEMEGEDDVRRKK